MSWHRHYLATMDEPQVRVEPSGEWTITTPSMELVVGSKPDILPHSYSQSISEELLIRAGHPDEIQEFTMKRVISEAAAVGSPMPPDLEPEIIPHPKLFMYEYRWSWWTVEW